MEPSMSQAERARLARELAQRGYSAAEIAIMVGPVDSEGQPDE